MNRKLVKRAVLILMFVSSFWVTCDHMARIVDPYVLGIYSQKKDTIDVLILGSSLAGSNFDGQVLWDEYGISAYSMWGMDQPIWNSYFYLMEALKYQKPKLVVLECHSVFQKQPYLDSVERQAASLTPLKISPNKLQAIKCSSPFELWDDMLLKLPLYHDYVTKLNKENYVKEDYLYNKGFTTTGTDIEVSYGREHSVYMCDSVEPLFEKCEKYLRLIIEKCKEEDIALLLIQSPSPEYDYYPLFNKVKEIAEEYGVRYVNYNYPENYIDIPDDEFYDYIHLNSKGARRLTPFVAEEMMSICHLDDHRGNKEYVSWDYNSAISNAVYLRSIKDYEDYLDELERDSFFVCFVDFERNKSADFHVKDYADDRGDITVGETFDNHVYEYMGHIFTADMQNCKNIILRYDGKLITNTEESAKMIMVYDKYSDSIVDTIIYYDKDKDSGVLSR